MLAFYISSFIEMLTFIGCQLNFLHDSFFVDDHVKKSLELFFWVCIKNFFNQIQKKREKRRMKKMKKKKKKYEFQDPF